MMIDIDYIKKHLIAQFQSENELVLAIENIKRGFTSQRELIGRYLQDPKMVAAYTVFYMATNYAKLAQIFDLIQIEKLLNKDLMYQFIDIGAGPGTFSFAVNDYLQDKFNHEVWGIDTATLMREQATKLAQNHPHWQSVKFVGSAQDVPLHSHRVAIFSHSFNEMGIEQAKKYLDILKPKWIIFIEPGTKDLFHELTKMRHELITQNFSTYYPCASDARCPMEKTDNWCHQYLHMHHDKEIERLAQMGGINRLWLPMTVHVYGPKRTRFQKLSRLVRSNRETKHSFEWQVCEAEENGELRIWDLEISKKFYSKAQQKDMALTCSGIELEVEKIKDLGPGKIRAKIINR